MKTFKIVCGTLLVCVSLGNAGVEYLKNNNDAMWAYFFASAIAIVLLIVFIAWKKIFTEDKTDERM